MADCGLPVRTANDKRPARQPKFQVATFDTVRKIALALPAVEEGTSYGTPALKWKKKLMARLREDGDVVFVVGFDNAELLMQSDPQTFYTTDHYRGYPSVLVRMSRVKKHQLADVVDMAWRYRAKL